MKKLLMLAVGAMSAMVAAAAVSGPRLVPDYNRDGVIDEADYERLAKDESFTIWLNDDDDAEGAEADEGKGDTNFALHDVPSGEGNDKDCEDGFVNGRCDLLDFFPVLVDVTGVDNWANYDWKLSSKSVNVVFTKLRADNAGDFHTKDVRGFDGETPLYKAAVENLAEEDGKLPDGFFSNESNEGRGVILIEGAALADGGLTLRGEKSGSDPVEVTLNLAVANVESLYDWMNLRENSAVRLPPSTSTDSCHFVFVHGYNMNHEEARGNAAEFYKKLYQSGSNAMFTAVEWRGDQSQIKFDILGVNITPNYFVNVENAFAAAKPFAEACEKLPGEKILVGHGLGNVLISSAIKDYGLDYTKFVMLDAEIAGKDFEADGRFANLPRTINYYSSSDSFFAESTLDVENCEKRELQGALVQEVGFWSLNEKIKNSPRAIELVNGICTNVFDIAETDVITPVQLADAGVIEMPAAGANSVATLENVNVEGFIEDTSYHEWPVREEVEDEVGGREWKHSTFREVAFYHTSKFYASLAAVGKPLADTVVYGTIRTAEKDNPIAEAIAIRDGKYVYVGDEQGAAAWIGGTTQIVDHRGKGMVMPGCTDGHSHYTMKFGLDNMKGGVVFALEDDTDTVLQKVDAAARAAAAAGTQSLFGFGWSIIALRITKKPTLADLDKVTHGVSTVIFDQGGHSAFCNSECLKRCGIIDDEGNVLITKIDGGLLELDDSGHPTGYVDERVTGYLTRMGGINADEIVDDEVAETTMRVSQELLLSTGYTIAMEGWSNMLHPRKLYEAAHRMDTNGELKLVFPMTYEVEPWQTDMTSEIECLASLMETYGTRHVLPEYLKIFMDGVVETKTGALSKPYKDGTDYKSFWSVDRLADITAKCNAKGLTVHTHVMGDAAIKETTDAYIQGGDGTHRNCLVHLRNVRKEDFQRFADNNIACTAGFTWHVANGEEVDAQFAEFLDDEYIKHAYPMKSFFDAGVKVSSHSDFPANIPCPQDPFGIMEVAITGQIVDSSTGKLTLPYDEQEFATREQVFEALTINGAWQLGLENERGSIKVGKWADFVLANQDVFACSATDIHKTKVVSTWFEGEKVYEAPAGSEANPWKIGEAGREVTAYISGGDTLVIKGAGAIGSMPWAGSADGITKLVKDDGVESTEALVKSLPALTNINGLTRDQFTSAAIGFVKADGFSAIEVTGGKATLDVVVSRAPSLGKSVEWTPVSTNKVEVSAPGEQGFFIVAPW